MKAIDRFERDDRGVNQGATVVPNIEIAKHSYQIPFHIYDSQVGIWYDGRYGRVFGIETNKATVVINKPSDSHVPDVERLQGEEKARVLEFVRQNIEEAK